MRDFPVDPDLPNVRSAFVAAVRDRWGLSPYQAVTAYHLARGLTDRAGLSARLGSSISAIHTHLSAAYDRVGVPDRTGLLVAVWPLYRRACRTAGSVAIAAPLIEQVLD